VGAHISIGGHACIFDVKVPPEVKTTV
jgi:hypothetical protein